MGGKSSQFRKWELSGQGSANRSTERGMNFHHRQLCVTQIICTQGAGACAGHALPTDMKSPPETMPPARTHTLTLTHRHTPAYPYPYWCVGRAAVFGQPGGGAAEGHHHEGLLHRPAVRPGVGHKARGALYICVDDEVWAEAHHHEGLLHRAAARPGVGHEARGTMGCFGSGDFVTVHVALYRCVDDGVWAEMAVYCHSCHHLWGTISPCDVGLVSTAGEFVTAHVAHNAATNSCVDDGV